MIAGNDHCPYAVITVGEHFMGIQAHPEFTPAYLDLLMQSRVERIGAQKIEDARKTLSEPTDQAIVARWMVNFFQRPVRPGPRCPDKFYPDMKSNDWQKFLLDNPSN